MRREAARSQISQSTTSKTLIVEDLASELGASRCFRRGRDANRLGATRAKRSRLHVIGKKASKTLRSLSRIAGSAWSIKSPERSESEDPDIQLESESETTSSAGGAVADVTATLGESPNGADSERSGGVGGTTPRVIG